MSSQSNYQHLKLMDQAHFITPKSSKSLGTDVVSRYRLVCKLFILCMRPNALVLSIHYLDSGMLKIFTFHTTKKPKLALSEFLSLSLCLFVCKKVFERIFVRFSREPVLRTNHLSTGSDRFWYRPTTSNYWYWTHCER